MDTVNSPAPAITLTASQRMWVNVFATTVTLLAVVLLAAAG